MIKKILVAMAVCLPMIVSAQKFATVDAQAIVDVMPETKAAQEKLAEVSKNYENEHEKLATELNNKYTEFQNLAADTPDAIKERRMQEIQDLNQRMEAFLQQAQQDLQRQNATLMQPIQDKVVNAIKAVGAEGNYTLVIPAGLAFYQGADVADVTDAVKAKLGI